MLIYHPAFDIHHCTFRLLRILETLPRELHPADRIRILDFFLLFPGEIEDVRLPSSARDLRKSLDIYRNRYDRVLDKPLVFSRLEPVQAAALKTLAGHRLIDREQLGRGVVLRTEAPLPTSLQTAVSAAPDSDVAALLAVIVQLGSINPYGKSGLKGRTDLLEFRYDPA